MRILTNSKDKHSCLSLNGVVQCLDFLSLNIIGLEASRCEVEDLVVDIEETGNTLIFQNNIKLGILLNFTLGLSLDLKGMVSWRILLMN